MIVDVTDDYIEVGQLHSVGNKAFEAIEESNTIIFHTNPDEESLPKDSFLQLNNIIRIERFEGVERLLLIGRCPLIRIPKKTHQVEAGISLCQGP